MGKNFIMRKTLIFVLVLMLILSSVACSCGGSNSIVGTWETPNGKSTIEFFKDGTCNTDNLYGDAFSGASSLNTDNYAVGENGKIVFSPGSYYEKTFYYKIIGNRLYLSGTKLTDEEIARIDGRAEYLVRK
ncbi:MAG: hypothetical protein FWF10_04605 [Clostridiales bacterium]|nr:hypothetical protein [Clostridiales bacterium]